MQSFTRPVRSALALALALTATPAMAQGEYSSTVFFGDSLTDSGFYRPFLIQQAGPSAAAVGRFSTNPGLVWAEFLAEYYGTSAAPAWQLSGTGAVVGADGSNYAAGGARITLGPGFPPALPTSLAPSLSTQINAYLSANGGRADPNALFTVWGGANDLFFHLNGLTTQAQFLQAAGQQVGLVGTLIAAGARYIMVPTMPDVGTTPFGLSQGPAGSAGISALATGYNQTLFGGLQAASLRVIPLDTFSFLREITADPATYGFVNVTTPACGATSSLICSPANYVAPGAAENYAFADGVHPTTGAHRMLGQYAVSVLEGPRQIAMLPQSAAMVGRSRADRVASHVAGKPESDGMRWWGGLRGDSQYQDDLYDGLTPAGTFGVDWSRGELVFGGFAGYGSGKQDFDNDSGNFKQADGTLGGFAGWYGERAWVNGQLSYTWLGYDVDREVHLGPATRKHSGSPDGSNLSAGISAGFEFGEGALRHGPVVSVLSQQVKVDGYAENNPSSTALAYSDQDFDSLIGSAGWQASYAINDHLRPYARLTYDREFEKAPAEAFAQLQSMSGVAPYAVPGLVLDRSYGTLLVGARAQVFGLDADVGLSATVQQEAGSNVSAFVTFSGSF